MPTIISAHDMLLVRSDCYRLTLQNQNNFNEFYLFLLRVPLKTLMSLYNISLSALCLSLLMYTMEFAKQTSKSGSLYVARIVKTLPRTRDNSFIAPKATYLLSRPSHQHNITLSTTNTTLYPNTNAKH